MSWRDDIIRGATRILITNTLGKLWDKQGTICPRTFQCLSTIWAIFPLLAYPFLPSTGLCTIPTEVFLIWPSALGLVHLYVVHHLEKIHGRPLSNPWQVWQVWQVMLMWMTLLASLDTHFAHSRGNPNVGKDDFGMSTNHFSDIYIWPLVEGHLFNWIREIWASSRGIVRLSRYVGLVMDVCTVFHFVRIFNQAVYIPALIPFVSRHVGWWTWLPENGAGEAFEPAWSKILAGCVLFMPVQLFLLAWPSAPCPKQHNE